jgi:hypothetical protein
VSPEVSRPIPDLSHVAVPLGHVGIGPQGWPERSFTVGYDPEPVQEVGGRSTKDVERDVQTTQHIFDQHGADCAITRIGRVGARLEFAPESVASRDTKQTGHTIWYDLDDSILSYGRARGARLANYQTYLDEHQLPSDAGFADELLRLSDAFSRWGDTYHADVHKATLQWMTGELVRAPKAATTDGILTACDRLGRVKRGEVTATPFWFDGLWFDGRSLVINRQQLQEAPVADISPVFAPCYRPGIHEDVLASAQEAHAAGHTVGILTLGNLPFQGAKLAKLYQDVQQSGDPWPFATAGMTLVPKGQFVGALAKEAGKNRAVREQYFPKPEHKLVLADDNPAQLESFLRAREAANHLNIGLHALRLQRPYDITKHGHRPWPQATHRSTNRSTYVARAGEAAIRLTDIVRTILD